MITGLENKQTNKHPNIQINKQINISNEINKWNFFLKLKIIKILYLICFIQFWEPLHCIKSNCKEIAFCIFTKEDDTTYGYKQSKKDSTQQLCSQLRPNLLLFFYVNYLLGATIITNKSCLIVVFLFLISTSLHVEFFVFIKPLGLFDIYVWNYHHAAKNDKLNLQKKFYLKKWVSNSTLKNQQSLREVDFSIFSKHVDIGV